MSATIVAKVLCCPTCSRFISASVRRTILQGPEGVQAARAVWMARLRTSHRPLSQPPVVHLGSGLEATVAQKGPWALVPPSHTHLHLDTPGAHLALDPTTKDILGAWDHPLLALECLETQEEEEGCLR